MAQNAIQGIDVVFKVREAGTSGSYLQVVCEIDNSMKLTNDTQETKTKCKTFTGIDVAKSNISGNAVYNITPTATEASYKDVADWQLNATSLEFKFENAAFTDDAGTSYAEGALFDFTGTGYFVDSDFKGTSGQVGQFSYTFKPESIALA